MPASPSCILSCVALCAAMFQAPVAYAQQARSSLPLEEMQEMARVFAMIKTDYVKPVDEGAIITACVKGMFKPLDEASLYYDKAGFKALREAPGDTSLHAGIGVSLVLRAGLPAVMSIEEGAPADVAGIRPRDLILEIEGQSMEDTDPDEAMRRLRGPAGTKVTLVLRRPGEATNRSFALERRKLQPPRVRGHLLLRDIGYVRIPSLYEKMPQDLADTLHKIQLAASDRPLKGMVLDLRNSPGGLLSHVVEAASAFLPDGTLVMTTEGRLPDANQEMVTGKSGDRSRMTPLNWPAAFRSVPLVVLVNAGTASGAEMLAAALQEQRKARLVGSKTFGWGAVQSLRPLTATTAARLTTAFMKTPAGRGVHGTQLEPDVPAPELTRSQDAGTPADEGLRKAMALLQSPS